MASEHPGPGAEPLLRRLLRRRVDDGAAEAVRPVRDAGQGPADGVQPRVAGAPDGEAPQALEPAERIDARTGKPIDELTDEDLPALDSIGPDSDVSAFLGKRISPELRRQALRRLFAQPKFNTVCLCAEYAENYANFTPLGSVVPHDLKLQLAREAERAARALAERMSGAGDAADAGASATVPASASTKVLDADPAHPDPSPNGAESQS